MSPRLPVALALLVSLASPALAGPPGMDGALGADAPPKDGTTTVTNPVLPGGGADPGVIRIGDDCYVTTTSGGDPAAFPIQRTRDFQTFEPAGAVFPEGQWPAWVAGDFWAPEVHRVGDRLVAYYTARDRSGRLCLGAASATTIAGPWTDLGRPMLRDPRVGLIDSSFFEDADGTRYLYWKTDGNDLRPREKTRIMVQRLSSDGLTLEGPATAVLENDRDWEGELIEGPHVVRRDGWYYLFYSGNHYYDETYATGVARARSPLGPFEKAPGPVLHSGDESPFTGPGHNAIVTTPAGEDLIVYHAWRKGQENGELPRVTLVQKVEWVDGWPRIGNGTPATSFELATKKPVVSKPEAPPTPATPKTNPEAPRARCFWAKLLDRVRELVRRALRAKSRGIVGGLGG